MPDLEVPLQNNSRATEYQSLNTEIGGHSKVCTAKCDETARCTRCTLLGHWMEEYYTAVAKDPQGDWSAPLIAVSHSKRCTLEMIHGSDTFEF